MDTEKFQKAEAIADLLDDYNLIIASLDADIAFNRKQIEFVENRLKINKPANVKIFGHLRLMGLKKAIHYQELKKITYQHYQDGLHEKMKNLELPEPKKNTSNSASNVADAESKK